SVALRRDTHKYVHVAHLGHPWPRWSRQSATEERGWHPTAFQADFAAEAAPTVAKSSCRGTIPASVLSEVPLMRQVVRELLDILQLEPLEQNLFRGQTRATGQRSIFGGLVAGQALMAASRTVPADRPVHSLHAYFLRPGDFNLPIIYEVDRIRDGASFTTRRVNAIQHGKAIFSLAASFAVEEEGVEHQNSMPQVPMPADLENDEK